MSSFDKASAKKISSGGPAALLMLLAAVLLGAVLGAAVTLSACRRAQFGQLARLAYGTAQAGPAAQEAALEALHPVFETGLAGPAAPGEAEQAEAFLRGYGYRPEELPLAVRPLLWGAAGAGLLGAACFWAASALRRLQRQRRAEGLTAYLDRINRGEQGILLAPARDEFALLRDELYKTVTALQTTRQQAETARARYAQNLADIAHQMKTPIAAASACLQLLEEGSAPLEGDGAAGSPGGTAASGPAASGSVTSGSAASGSVTSGPAAQARRQLTRLDALGQALLTLSRIDAGALPLASSPVDAYTALSLAADTLGQTPAARNITFELEEHGPAAFLGDMEWTVEALLNLMKNCAAHTPPGGRVLCGYTQNPLYLEITVRDEGEGFAKEDLPRLFDRFYRGRRAAGEGVGIGLALAKAIFEAQNGVLTAQNHPEGGAMFTVRLYPR